MMVSSTDDIAGQLITKKSSPTQVIVPSSLPSVRGQFRPVMRITLTCFPTDLRAIPIKNSSVKVNLLHSRLLGDGVSLQFGSEYPNLHPVDASRRTHTIAKRTRTPTTTPTMTMDIPLSGFLRHVY
jgi:hypothetical protein